MPRSVRPPVCALLSAVVLSAGLTAVPSPALAAPAPPPDFYSSFEPGEPAPNWTDTVDTGPDGKPKAHGVNGANGTAIPGDVRGKLAEATASSENPEGGETAPNLADGKPESKWLSKNPTAWAQLAMTEPVTITRYGLTSANDFDERDPQDWKLQGSADGTTWTDLDAQTGQEFTERFQPKEYRLAAPATFQYFRLDITKNNGGPLLQLAELLLANDEPAPPPLPNMRSFPDGGPTGGYTNKSRAGYSGSRAFRYSGTHTVEGHGFSYNKIFDVDLPVGDATELSYKVFPEFSGDDLKYPSTNVAVDLAFTDGSYLSELGAADQYGFALSPAGQGAAKSLSINQWNLVRSSIGTVAKGKVIDRILVGYDNPAGPAPLQGWLDDIRLGAGTPAPPANARPSDHVLTTRGTHANSTFSRGNNFPATAVPHGFNFWTPVTDAGSTSWLYRYHEGNNAQNLPTAQAFSVSHEPSPWMGDRQTFQVQPSLATGVPDANRDARELAFKHENEEAKAHYYGVRFENGIRTELAPTDHAALFRFTFPGADANLIFDNVNNNGGLTLDKANGTLSGFSDVKSGLSAGAGRLFVYAEFDKPVSAGDKLPGEGRDNVRGYLRFDTGGSNTVQMRIATSLISVDQAKKNLGQEIAAGATLESVRDAAQAAWDEKLNVIQVEGASADQLQTLYSNLYRLFLYPNSGYENVGTKEQPKIQYASPVAPKTGQDTPTHTGSKLVDGEIFVNNGFWDTYRTTWPAYALLTPTMAGKMVDGFTQQYRDGGWISRWSSPGYANLMTGTSSDVAFADAYLKGVKNFDVQSAYDAALKNASVTPPNASVGRKGLDTSIFLGYTSTATGEGMSWGIEGYVNDFGIANMSKQLYDEAAADDPRKQEYLENHEYFTNRAQNYVNTFDPNVNFFQGKSPTGEWRVPASEYEPREWGHDYTETNAWNMAFTVPHDGNGLANLYGGRDGLAKKLDEFWATPETATFPGSYGGVIHEMREARDVRMGQYGHSNQPSHHIPYMYNYAGQPSKTQEKVREVLSRLYLGGELGQGYAGDEDNGEMSAWYIFSALGFYPLQMGKADYAIGSPLFTKATVNLENGKKLVINAPQNNAKNVYVQGLKVNGKDHSSTSLPHDLLANGGTLDFTMGPQPSAWGTGAGDAPESITEGTAVASPLHDLTGPGKGTATAESGDVATLFDNTSGSESKPGSWVQYQLNSDNEAASFYTLTSVKGAGDPKSWVLKGSYDGQTWAVVDERKDQSFKWRQHTRAFKAAKPGHYTHYRLEITATEGGPAGLAEVELLGKPDPVCTTTINQDHNGALAVTSGVTCVDGVTVRGPVTVADGASLVVDGGAISGPISASNAGSVRFLGTKVTGPISITGSTGTVALEHSTVYGPVALDGNTGPSVLVAANTVQGSVSCGGNTQPVNNTLVNSVRGTVAGQCAGL
ncbi:GH92 family glycosyl hydrolase [Amycolatopsis sp. 195334CR]|uniref:GH92 family glycosyl hydrolase n=1 Tax=Amycolatopsis sp. 195334CR TaxID=2814588 RepID=UPI001A8EC2B5|nr:GH92 family glycosyl hydrolase [Amycolatopsis sp. 195334CR]MBN6040161.1 GH92 family glycosyl hydrolase [Amycolatopsis sp. 195334CR]